MNSNNNAQAKRKFLTKVFVVIFLFIVLRYFYIQIIKNEKFFEDSVDNSITKIRSMPSRGIIYDRNGKVIVANRNSFSIKIYPNH